MPLVILIVLGLFIAGYAISARYFKEPLKRFFVGLAIGAGLCVVALGLCFAGCVLMWKGI